MTATVFYISSLSTDHSIDHQVERAREAGFKIDEVIVDYGISALNTKLAHRPEGGRLFDRLRKGDTLVVCWVDQLGRNYQELTDTISQFMRQGAIIRTLINGVTFDGATTDPTQAAVRDGLLAFIAGAALAQAQIKKETQRAGIQSAQENNPLAYRGRKPSYSRQQFDLVRKMAELGEAGTSEIARASGLTRQTVLRIRRDMAEAERALTRWGI